jgi:hypothetical protein
VPSSNASGVRPGTIRTIRHPPIRLRRRAASVGLWRVSERSIAGDHLYMVDDCSVYDARRDEFWVRFSHVFGPPNLSLSCS